MNNTHRTSNLVSHKVEGARYFQVFESNVIDICLADEIIYGSVMLLWRFHLS